MKNISQFNKYLQCATLALAFTTSLTTSISHAQSAAPASLVQLKQRNQRGQNTFLGRPRDRTFAARPSSADRPELTGPDVKLVYAARSRFAGVILGRVASGAGGR
jgi:hypothetical protein